MRAPHPSRRPHASECPVPWSSSAAVPRTAGMLERLAANRPELLDGALQSTWWSRTPRAAGRIWRYEQHPGLMLNSAAADVTMFTDASVQCEGPAVDGPGLAKWAAGVLDGSIADVPELPAELRRQLAEPSPAPPSPPGSCRASTWNGSSAAPSPPSAGRHRHRPPGHGVRRSNRCRTGRRRTARRPAATSCGWPAARRCAPTSWSPPWGTRIRCRMRPLRRGPASPPGTARSTRRPATPPTSTIQPLAAGQDVIVSGMGLAFVDLLVLLMEGRGGRFEELPDGGLRYVPSGAEPRLWAGSRRGVPYHSKITSAAARRRRPASRAFFTAEAVGALLAAPGELDFRAQLWPLIAKDAGYGVLPRAVHRLPGAGPDRLGRNSPNGSPRLDWYSPERERLVAESVPDAELHLDLEAAGPSLRRAASFAGLRGRPGGSGALHRPRPRAAHRRRTTPRRWPSSWPCSRSYMELGRLVPAERLNARSQQTVHGWWHGFFSFVDSGPPPRRLREMLALHRAGLLQFIGPGLEITAEESPAGSSPARPRPESPSAARR